MDDLRKLEILDCMCEISLSSPEKSAAEILALMTDCEKDGVSFPPFVRYAVMEFVMRNWIRVAVRGSGRSRVYFVLDEEAMVCKIGYSEAIDERISQMQCHNHHHLRLLGHIPGGRRLEKAWHKKVAHLRVSGEWFSYTEDLKSEIEKALVS